MFLEFQLRKILKNKYIIPDPNFDNSDMKSVFNDMQGRVVLLGKVEFHRA